MPCTASGTRGRRRCSRSRSAWAPPGTRPAAQAGRCRDRATRCSATGWNWDFAPVQDLARDNRWGRTYETWAEEPALAAAHGRRERPRAADPARADGARCRRHGQAFRRLLAIDQRARPQRGAAAAQLSAEHDPPVVRGRASMPGRGPVMVDSGSINGVPATASHYLLTDILREPAGLQGRGDQRLPGRAGAADRLPHRPGSGRRHRQGRQRRRRHEHAGLRRRPVAGRGAAGRRDRQRSPRPGSTRPCGGSSR